MSPNSREVPVATTPRFVLSRPHGTTIGHGEAASFTSPASASAALRTGEVDSIFGALPFTRTHHAALVAPISLEHTRRPWSAVPAGPLPRCTIDTPDTDEHLHRVRAALSMLDDPSDPLVKVVLARALTLHATDPVDPVSLLSALVAGTTTGNGFLSALSTAGGEFEGKFLVGASPELLIRKQGDTVSCHPLAGSAPRYDDPERDAASGRTLLASGKDFREHAFVVDALRTALTPFCTQLDIADAPTLTSTAQMWHLGTPVTGTLAEKSTSALDLALALHPTPAVCGTPTDRAFAAIAELEPERGFYGGAVGWCDSNGDGEWMVAIRCVEVASDGLSLRAWAGGGIVAGSDPVAELDETTAKFRTVLSVFPDPAFTS